MDFESIEKLSDNQINNLYDRFLEDESSEILAGGITQEGRWTLKKIECDNGNSGYVIQNNYVEAWRYDGCFTDSVTTPYASSIRDICRTGIGYACIQSIGDDEYQPIADGVITVKKVICNNGYTNYLIQYNYYERGDTCFYGQGNPFFRAGHPAGYQSNSAVAHICGARFSAFGYACVITYGYMAL